MTNTIDCDLKEILTRLDGRFNKLEPKIDKIDQVAEDLSDFKIKVSEDFGRLRTDLTRVENSSTGEIKVLAEKVDGMTKGVDTQEFINRKLGKIELVGMSNQHSFNIPKPTRRS